MPCYNPQKVLNPSVSRLIKLRRYTAGELSKTQSNDYNQLLQTIGRSLFVYIPCGRCEGCRRARRADLVARLQLAHVKYRERLGVFLTLTFSDSALRGLQAGPDVIPEKHRVSAVLRRFWDRLRKRFGSTPPHFIIDELGGEKGRYHLHGVAYFDRSWFTTADPFDLRRKIAQIISECWSSGYIYVGWCSNRTITYVSKYIVKINNHNESFTPRTWSSRNFYYSIRRADSDRATLLGSPATAALRINGRLYPYPRSYRQRLSGFWDRLPARAAFLEIPFDARYYSIPGIPCASYSAWQSYYSGIAERYRLPVDRPCNSDITPDYDFGLPF